MPLCRPRANSLQLSIERLRITTWRPPRPPTPRRSTYPQPGTPSSKVTSIMDPDVPPIPPMSYWEPDTPSPVSPYNPFLSPPAHGLGAPDAIASPLLPASPLSIFDNQDQRTFSSSISPQPSPIARYELSPRFLNPRTPPLPPTMKSGVADAVAQRGRSHSTMWSVPASELDKMKHQPLYDMIIAVQEKVRGTRNHVKEHEFVGSGMRAYVKYATMKKRRERRKVGTIKHQLDV